MLLSAKLKKISAKLFKKKKKKKRSLSAKNQCVYEALSCIMGFHRINSINTVKYGI